MLPLLEGKRQLKGKPYDQENKPLNHIRNQSINVSAVPVTPRSNPNARSTDTCQTAAEYQATLDRKNAAACKHQVAFPADHLKSGSKN